MAAGDMTTLANVKAWLNISTSTNDAELSRLITAASRFALNYIGRPSILAHAVNERRNGTGTYCMMLREFPVVSVLSVTLNDQVVPVQPVGQSLAGGYFLDAWDGQDASGPQKVNLVGYMFYRGIGNVSIAYTAGFKTSETDVVPVSPFQITPSTRPWAADAGVTYANGTALTAVASAPSTGQYAVSASGVYTFSAGDAGQSMIISYSYTPEDLSNAVMELVGERMRTKERIGLASKSLGGQETTAFSQKDLNDAAHGFLDQFRLVAPIGR